MEIYRNFERGSMDLVGFIRLASETNPGFWIDAK